MAQAPPSCLPTEAASPNSKAAFPAHFQIPFSFMDRFTKGLLWTIGILAVVAVALRLWVFKVWTIPDDPQLAASIAPTLRAGDVVLVLTRGEMGFGDLVRCAHPEAEEPGQFVIGRVVGTQADVVETDGPKLIVNNKRIDASTACKEKTFSVEHPTSGSPVELKCDVVEMAGGWHYRGKSDKKSMFQSKTKTEVGADMFFVLSDNREFPYDSRNYGAVAKSTCKERIFYRLWSKEGWSDDKARMTYIH